MKEKDELRRRLRTEKQEGKSSSLPVGQEDPAAVYLPLGIEKYKTLFSFLSLPGEPDTEPLNRLALSRGLILAAPRVEGENLGFYRLTSAEGPFALGAYGIREPLSDAPALWLPRPPERLRDPGACETTPPAPCGPAGSTLPQAIPLIPFDFPLLIAVPGLAFTPDGRRLGRGKGYYDRFLASFLEVHRARQGDITLLGICPPGRLLASIPTEEHDLCLDCLIAEKAYIICRDYR